jgi:hypothetical protein
MKLGGTYFVFRALCSEVLVHPSRCIQVGGKVRKNPEPNNLKPRVRHVTKTRDARLHIFTYLLLLHPHHLVIIQSSSSSCKPKLPKNKRYINSKDDDSLISSSVRRNSCSKPSDCSNPAEGRNGVHRISKVFPKKSECCSSLIIFLETYFQRKTFSLVSEPPPTLRTIVESFPQ